MKLCRIGGFLAALAVGALLFVGSAPATAATPVAKITLASPSFALPLGGAVHKENDLIKPTVGRIVLFDDNQTASRKQAAIVTDVHSDICINVCVFPSYGSPVSVTSVRLIQDGEEPPKTGEGRFCEWMPYQKGQAAKTEELEAKIAG